MKAKITSFIMSLMTLLMTGILCFLGLIIYNEIKKNNLVGDVQEFVSNITISSESLNEEMKSPEVIESILSSSEQENNNFDSNINKIDKYFYSQLDEYSKVIYKAIENNKENMKIGTYEIDLGTEFSQILSNSNGEKLLGNYYQAAIEAYTYDNPDVFYIDFSKLYLNIETTTRGNKKTYRVFLNSGNEANYLTNEFQSREKVEFGISEIEKVKTYFVKNKKADTYQNIKLVHDYLVESIEYDQSISQANIYNIYGAIVNKLSVCEGYAKAFKYFMDSLEIPCTIVIGKATNSEGNTENHAWNYVQLNGLWYAIDCTWDDPIIIGSGFLNNSLKYKYFLVGENEFSKSHMPNGQFTENGKVFEFPNLNKIDY